MRRIELDASMLADARRDDTLVRRDDAVLSVEGPGAETCLQGLLTCDIVKDAPPLRWGAVLSPKGMIITDLWIARDAERFHLVVPREGVDALRDVFRRSLPPRLARVIDRSEELVAWWAMGAAADVAGGFTVVPLVPAPFSRLIVAPRGAERRGTVLPPEVGDAFALLQGWPALGHEIDDRTLPQEVRFDELRGVDYDKGCYVGQETVARLHFRGHANRTLRAITGTGAPPESTTIVDASGKDVGTVASLLVTDAAWCASSRLRREVATGSDVRVSGVSARVQEFPLTVLLPENTTPRIT